LIILNKIHSRTKQIADLAECFLWQGTVLQIKLFLDANIITFLRMEISSLYWNQPDWCKQIRELRMDVERV
jgi:hypothetical protein